MDTDEVCGKLDWTFLGSASSHSQFAGVLGGFLFASVVLLFGTPRSNGRTPPDLSLLLSAFFVLMLDSFLFGVIAGERVCARAHTEGTVASGLLAVGAGAIFAGLTRLFESHRAGTDFARLSRLMVYASQIISMFLIAVTVFGFTDHISETHAWQFGKLPPWVMWAYTVTVLILLAVAIYRRPQDVIDTERTVRLAAYASIPYALISVAIFGIASATPQADWEGSVPIPLVLSAIIIVLVLPPAALLTLARTLPRVHIDVTTSNGEAPQPIQAPPPQPGLPSEESTAGADSPA